MGVELQLIEQLLTGKLLEKLRGEHAKIETTRKKAEANLARLESSELDVVRTALKGLLSNGKRKELPLLEQLIIEELPQHQNFPLLLAALQAQVPVWLFGDAGSGKTTAAEIAAQTLGLPFRFISVCPTTTKSELMGYRDATGQYRSTAFREIFEHGGVFLIDEIDNGNPSTLSVLNTALSNNHCAFPDGNIPRHEKCLIVAAANTIGRGADVKYIGRNGLDVTTLDRFVFVRMDIDEHLESVFIGGEYKPDTQVKLNHGGIIKVETWIKHVRAARKACRELGIQHLISPRATLYGQRLIAVGVGKTHLLEMCLWKGMRETDREKIRAKVKGGI